MAKSANSPTKFDENQPGQSNLDQPIDWEDQFAQHQGWLRKILRCRVKPAVVDDCLQEIGLAIAKQSNRPVDPEKVPAWLYRLAVRHAINVHRRNGRQQNLMNGFKETRPDQSELTTEPLDWLVKFEQQSLVRQALDGLRPQEKEILILKYTENWSYKQLAKHLGTSTTTVEYRLVKAKKNLRRLLIDLQVMDSKLEAYS